MALTLAVREEVLGKSEPDSFYREATQLYNVGSKVVIATQAKSDLGGHQCSDQKLT